MNASLPETAVHDVDVWCFFYEEALQDPGRVMDYEALLEPEERARQQAYLFDKDRLMYLATRALVRTVLSHHVPRAPASWRFVCGPRGKPRLAEPPPCGPMHFNLSNTEGLVVCAVSRTCDRLGIDVENISRPAALQGIAESHFSPTELASWSALPPPRQREGFFRLWTLKESFIKATGDGLSVPLDQFSFKLPVGLPETAHDIAVGFEPALGETGSHWRFSQWRMREGYVVALGADTRGAPLRCRLRLAAPLKQCHGNSLESAP